MRKSRIKGEIKRTYIIILFLLVEQAWEKGRTGQEKPALCRRLGCRQSKEESRWCLLQITLPMANFFFNRAAPSSRESRSCRVAPMWHTDCPDTTRVAHAASWQRARKMPSLKYPQSHSLTACSCRWQTLLTSDPLAKGNVQAGALWKPLSSSTRCLDQYSPCLFTLLFWAPWRGTAAKPYLGIGSGGGIGCVQVAWSMHKERGHQHTRDRCTKAEEARDYPPEGSLLASPSESHGVKWQ